MAAPIKHEGGMSLAEIAEAENTTPAAIHVLIGRAMKKLRKNGLHITTARALALELESHRATENIVRTGRRAR